MKLKCAFCGWIMQTPADCLDHPCTGYVDPLPRRADLPKGEWTEIDLREKDR